MNPELNLWPADCQLERFATKQKKTCRNCLGDTLSSFTATAELKPYIDWAASNWINWGRTPRFSRSKLHHAQINNSLIVLIALNDKTDNKINDPYRHSTNKLRHSTYSKALGLEWYRNSSERILYRWGLKLTSLTIHMQVLSLLVCTRQRQVPGCLLANDKGNCNDTMTKNHLFSCWRFGGSQLHFFAM